jgi:hypothetical protein
VKANVEREFLGAVKKWKLFYSAHKIDSITIPGVGHCAGNVVPGKDARDDWRPHGMKNWTGLMLEQVIVETKDVDTWNRMRFETRGMLY